MTILDGKVGLVAGCGLEIRYHRSDSRITDERSDPGLSTAQLVGFQKWSTGRIRCEQADRAHERLSLIYFIAAD